MKTKILLFALLCGAANAQSITIKTPTPIAQQTAYADGWFAAYIDGWTIHEFHRRADELENDDDQAELNKIWTDIKTLAANMEFGWAKLSDEQKIAQTGTPFWKRNVGLPRRLSKSQNKKFVEALSK